MTCEATNGRREHPGAHAMPGTFSGGPKGIPIYSTVEVAMEQPSSNRQGIVSRRDSNPQDPGNNTNNFVPLIVAGLAAHTTQLAAVVR